jgi:hypothetical protein
LAQYHVMLDGQGYLIDLGSYRKAMAPVLATKTRAGDPRYGDFAVGSVWAQEGWRTGLPGAAPGTTGGSTDGAIGGPAYELGVGIDPGQGDLRLGRSLTSVYQPGLGVTEIYALAVYQGALYAIQGNGGKIWSSPDGTTWSQVYDTGKASLRSIAPFNGWLVVGSGADGALFRYDGATWSLWTTLSGTAVRALQGGGPGGSAEYLYAGLSQSGGRSALVQVSNTATATTLHQPKDSAIEAIGVAFGWLWYGSVDDTAGVRGELFRSDGSTWEHVTSLPDNAVSAFGLYRNQLYAASRTRGKVWAVTERGLTEVWTVPEVTGIGGVSAYALPIRALGVDNDRLHVPVVDAQGLGTYVYDGTGWSLPNTGGLGQEARGLVAFGGNLYLSTKSNAGARVYRVDSQHPASGTVVTDWFDAELAATDKAWIRLTLFHAALASGQSVTVDYALDGSGTWVNLGISNSVGATNKGLTFPLATAGKRLRLRLTLSTTDPSASPKLTGMLVDYLLMPEAKREWRFGVRLEGSAALPMTRLDGTNEPLDSRALAATLWLSKSRKQALAFTDLDGTSAIVWFRELEERPAQLSQRQGLATRGEVTLVEV